MVVTGHTSGPPPDPTPDPATDPAPDLAGGATGRGSRSVSIRDVAAAAGVSYQTVSRVINGHPSVKESTRELVLATIDNLGFRPNRAARALAGGPVQSVTVLTPNTTLYGHRSALQGIEPAKIGDALADAVPTMGAAAIEDLATTTACLDRSRPSAAPSGAAWLAAVLLAAVLLAAGPSSSASTRAHACGA